MTWSLHVHSIVLLMFLFVLKLDLIYVDYWHIIHLNLLCVLINVDRSLLLVLGRHNKFYN